jgi:hypothetical protein
MTPMRGQDRKLFTGPELLLLRSSMPSEINAFTAARLRTLIKRTRRVSDKYRDLVRRQLRARKRRTSRGGVSEQSNVRTQRKARLLAEALDRFENRLRRLERGEWQRTGLPAKPPCPARAAQREALRREQQRRQAAGEAAHASRKARTFQQSRLREIQAHLRAHGRRRQATRDARR